MFLFPGGQVVVTRLSDDIFLTTAERKSKMSHFFLLRRNWRTKTLSSSICDAMKVVQSKAWNIDKINFCLSTHRGVDPVPDAHDQVLATLLRRSMAVQAPPEVWERIKENAVQKRRMHLTG
jgi:hypothetical protein